MSLSVACRSFFAALFNREVSERLERTLLGDDLRVPSAEIAAARTVPPQRSDAVALLAALQREARFVDFIKESLVGASDEQIGAVVRDVHRDCGAVLERMFAIRPLVDGDEGTTIEVTAGFDAARFRLTGNVQRSPPYRGKLGHHGWQAMRSDVPSWNGRPDSALMISPADVEL